MLKHRVDFNNVDKTVRDKIVKGSVIPRPIAWVTSLNEDASVNLAPFSFFSEISSTLLAISFINVEDRQKDTYMNILREKEAVIHIVDESLIEQMDLTGDPLPKNKSEIDQSGLTLSPSVKVKTPGIDQALVRLEVRLEQAIPLMDYEGDKEEGNLVILRVLAAVLDNKVYDPAGNYILADKLKPVSRLGGPNYAGINILDFKRKF